MSHGFGKFFSFHGSLHINIMKKTVQNNTLISLVANPFVSESKESNRKVLSERLLSFARQIALGMVSTLL